MVGMTLILTGNKRNNDMKHLALYFGMTILLLASCSTQEKDFLPPTLEDTIFYASFEQPCDDGTKVYVNEDLLLRWTADDRVSIFNKNTYNQLYVFTGETGDNAGGFRKVDTDEFMTGNAIPNIVSVYPYQASTKISEREVITVTLPSEQHYADNTFGLGANTMVSVSSDNFLQYRNVGGYLMFRLYGEGVSVSSIMLKGNQGEIIAGKAYISMPEDGIPIVEMASDAIKKITLTCDTPVQLGATQEQSTPFWFVVPPVLFSKGFTITVYDSFGRFFEKSTSKSVSIERSNLSKMSPLEVEMITPAVPVPEAVDLGLSVKWASFNLGASKPEEYGDYYAWGETEPYYEPGFSQSVSPIWRDGKESGYSIDSYRWCMGSMYTFTKYCQNSDYGYNGFTDDKFVLDPEDDAAYVNLRGEWRMPMPDEVWELINNCTSEWTALDGVYGQKVTGPNGNSIFLPAAGVRSGTHFYDLNYGGSYWASSLDTSNPYPGTACKFEFDSKSLFGGSSGRSLGYSIRPVYGEPILVNVPVESVYLSKTQLSLFVGVNTSLEARVLPYNATNQRVSWSSSDVSIATVTNSGVVTGVSPGSAVITATTDDGGKTATCNVTVVASSPYSIVPPEAVDLGLPSGLKWASFNLGATKPEEYGGYFAWGETEPYYSSQNPLIWKEGKEDGYTWSSYRWCMGSEYTLTKYCQRTDRGYNGYTDDKTVLDPVDDAANVNLGGKWRMPTDSEFSELQYNCSWVWTSLNGIYGLRVTGPNGNSIFLPTAGIRGGTNLTYALADGCYWSSSLDTECPQYALYVSINSNSSDNVRRSYTYRFRGYSIRPVCAE